MKNLNHADIMNLPIKAAFKIHGDSFFPENYKMQ